MISFAAITSAGCGTIDSAYQSTKSGFAGLQPDMEAWHGHSYDELAESWGEPSSQVQLGEDLVAYTWNGPNGDCRRTFTVRSEKIVGSSDTDC